MAEDAFAAWWANTDVQERVKKQRLGSYYSQYQNGNANHWLIIGSDSGNIRKKLDKVKRGSKPSNKTTSDWEKLMKDTGLKLWQQEGSPGLKELQEGTSETNATTEPSGTHETTFDAEGNQNVYDTLFQSYKERHPDSVGENNEAPVQNIHPQVVDQPLEGSKLERWKQARGELATEMLLSNETFETWLDEHDIAIARNSGQGNNCLIISLVQHATGNYGSEHASVVQAIRQDLISQFSQLVMNQPLHSDDPAFVWLVQRINQHFLVSLNPIFVQAEEGLPFLLGTQLGANHAVIWDQGGHFEALYKKK